MDIKSSKYTQRMDSFEDVIDHEVYYEDKDYIEFWETIEDAKIDGHKKLKELLKTGKIRIGDYIPVKRKISNAENVEVGRVNDEVFLDILPQNSVNLKKISIGIDNVAFSRESIDTTDQEKQMWKTDKEQVLKTDNITKPKYETVFQIILNHVFNGHEIILGILDDLVEQHSEENCLKCFDNTSRGKICINVNEMFYCCSTKRQKGERGACNCDSQKVQHRRFRLVKALIDIENERGEDNNIKKIFKHPVVEILILKKWDYYKMAYMIHGRFFFLFVFLATTFVQIVIQGESKNKCNPKNLLNKTNIDCEDWLYNGSWIVNESHWAKNLVNLSNKYDFLLIFKYEQDTFGIFIAAMIALFLIQLGKLLYTLTVGFFPNQEIDDNSVRMKHNMKRSKQTITSCSVNLIFIVIFTSILLNPFDSELNFMAAFLSFLCVYFSVKEIIQFFLLVVKPARKGHESVFKVFSKIFSNRYLTDPENYLEISFFISVPVAICQKFALKFHNNFTEDQQDYFRGLIALGLFSAWMSLVIKLGNVSHNIVGEFVKIFYSIIRTKLLAYVKVCFLLMIAFCLAFYIILDGHIKPTADGLTFDGYSFWVNLATTVTMSTGEFNTSDFYGNIDDHKIIKVFAMVFLIGLVVLSTLILVNLLVAAVVSDYDSMKNNVDVENLYFIAEYIMEEEVYKTGWYKWLKFSTWFEYLFPSLQKKKESTIEFCPHLVCNNSCDKAPLPIPRPGVEGNDPSMEANEREPLYLRLQEIRGRNRKLCEDHGGKKESKKLKNPAQLRRVSTRLRKQYLRKMTI